MARRRYRFKDRAEAEAAHTRAEAEALYALQAVNALRGDQVTWTPEEEADGSRFRLGGFHLLGAVGGLVILEEETSTGTTRRIDLLDNLTRTAHEHARHGQAWAHAVGRLCERMRLERARLCEG